MPIRRIREYAELVGEGEGNEAARLALLEAHRSEVLGRLREIEQNLELIDYKIELYRERSGRRQRAQPAVAPERCSACSAPAAGV
jgi:DNA-binding transcriptional MerR regulator